MRPKKALTVADDTDIFVLFLHFCCEEDILVQASTSVLMVSLINGYIVLDINATVKQHCDIIPANWL